VIFALYILWMVGNALEEAWGAFKLNLYVLTGVICMTVASLLFGAGADGVVFYTSIFFAFATVYPNFTFLLFFILPVKVKWLAFISAGFLALQALGPSGAARAAAVAIVVNYLLFFGEYWVHYFKNRAETKERRARFDAARLPEDEALHRCKICNRTENDPADLDFRVAPDGEEYCTEHLPAKK